MSRAIAGRRLLESLIHAENGASEFAQHNLSRELFYGGEEELFDLCQRHMLEYGCLPSPATILEAVNIAVESPGEPPAFYLSQTRARHLYRELRVMLEHAAKQLPEYRDSPTTVLDALSERIVSLAVGQRSAQIVDFAKDAAEMIEREYALRWKLGDNYGLLSGYPSLDRLSLGLSAGDVMSIVGRPAAGKTYHMLSMAQHAWHAQHKRIMFVSMEIKPLLITQRLAAMYSHVPITDLRGARLTSKSRQRLYEELRLLPDTHPPFWVVDGNLAASVTDIVMMARRLKPDAVFIDGAYLLRHPNPRVSKHERIADNIESIKSDLAGNLMLPAIVSYQFNRQLPGKKKLKDDGNGVDFIAGSDAIGQISTIVLGLLQDDSPETKVRRVIDVLKGRSGEVGRFAVNWIFDDFPYMDFSEVPPESLDIPDDLEFI